MRGFAWGLVIGIVLVLADCWASDLFGVDDMRPLKVQMVEAMVESKENRRVAINLDALSHLGLGDVVELTHESQFIHNCPLRIVAEEGDVREGYAENYRAGVKVTCPHGVVTYIDSTNAGGFAKKTVRVYKRETDEWKTALSRMIIQDMPKISARPR